MAWLSLVLYPVGRVVTFLSMGMLKLLGLKGRRCALLTTSLSLSNSPVMLKLLPVAPFQKVS